MEPEQAQEGAERSLWIAEERVQSALRRYFERRASRNDVDDLVQTTLADALAAKRAPADRAEWDQWVYGIARHKLADHFRRRKNEFPLDEAEAAAAESAHQEARELLKWAERELPEGEHAKTTLEVLLEEADGESIELLARARSLPPARLRQRVVRMREHFRSRWALYLAVLGVFGVTAAFVVHHLLLVCCALPPEIAEEVRPPVDPAVERAHELRRLALEKCRAQSFEECLKGLDSARELDPAGDAATEVVEQRAAARRALDARVPVPEPSPSSSPPAPSSRTREVAPVPTATPRSTPPAPKANTGSSL